MTRPPKAGKRSYSLERPAPEARGERSDILRSRHPQNINGEGFCHPQGHSEAEDGEAVDRFPTVDRLSFGSGEEQRDRRTARLLAMIGRKRRKWTLKRLIALRERLEQQGKDIAASKAKLDKIMNS